MKSLILCAFVFILASSSSTEQMLKDIMRSDNIKICAIETNATASDMYTKEEVLANVPAESANAERTQKLGCFFFCILKKENVMEGTNINQAQMETKLSIILGGKQDIAREIAHKCINEVENITEGCEKCFSLYSCGLKDLVNAMERHEEHEKEETGEVETEQSLNKPKEMIEEAEAEQTV